MGPGRHEVEFRYESPWIRRGVLVSAGSLLALLAFAALYGRFGARSRSAAP